MSQAEAQTQTQSMTLNCLMWGSPIEEMFRIKVPIDNCVFDLKQHIQTAKPEHLKGVDLGRVNLYQVAIELSDADQVNGLLKSLDLEALSMQRLRLMSTRLSNVFSIATDTEDLHIIVVPPTVGVPQPPDEIRVVYWVRGRSTASIFPITFSRRQSVADLQRAIIQSNFSKVKLHLEDIHLYRVSIPFNDPNLDEKLQSLTFDDTEPLRPTDDLYRVFDGHLPKDYVHIVVDLDWSTRKRPTTPTQDLQTRRQTYIDGVPTGAPSQRGQTKAFRDFQTNPSYTIHCNRPSTAAAPIPVTLLHPVFGQFLDDCKMHEVMAEENAFAWQLSVDMSELFVKEDESPQQDEDGRAPAFCRLLKHFGLTFIPTTIEYAGKKPSQSKKCFTDGDIGSNGLRYAILEVKNEVGSGRAEPYAQASLYYQEGTRELAHKTSSVLPCFLALLFGPYIAFAGAAWNERPAIQMLSAALPLHHDTSDNEMHTAVARHLCAFRKAIHTLANYYNGLDLSSALRAPSHQAFPYLASFRSLENRQQNFEYLRQLEGRLIFFGRLSDTDTTHNDICIKFVRSYSKDAHEFCASLDHAPKLLGFEELPGGWLMVVMEKLGFHYLPLHEFTDLPSASRELLVDSIEKTILQLHVNGFVHGDVRDTNIMVHKQNTSKFMIMDWDWSGRIRQARYPILVNREDIERPDGAIDGQLILPEHDLAMLGYIREAQTGLKRAPSVGGPSQCPGKRRRTF